MTSSSPQSRLEAFRSRELKPDERKLEGDVEKFGCHIIHVREERNLPGWSYTVGLFESYHQPEILVVGLKTDTAQYLLNEVANRLKNGLGIHDGLRQSGLLDKVDCEFKQVEERQELKGVMGYAFWFYSGDSFPVFQCIYPDLENKFPWEDSFDTSWRNRQALLFTGAPLTCLEKDFWASHDPNSSLYDWKFEDPPHTGVYTTKPIMSDEEAIVYVCHDAEDGAWQFHGPSESKRESIAFVCFHHIVDKDGSIKELRNLPLGWCAWRRSPSDPWVREPKSKEQQS
jgi:hypothetical protein